MKKGIFSTYIQILITILLFKEQTHNLQFEIAILEKKLNENWIEFVHGRLSWYSPRVNFLWVLQTFFPGYVGGFQAKIFDKKLEEGSKKGPKIGPNLQEISLLLFWKVPRGSEFC